MTIHDHKFTVHHVDDDNDANIVRLVMVTKAYLETNGSPQNAAFIARAVSKSARFLNDQRRFMYRDPHDHNDHYARQDYIERQALLRLLSGTSN